MQASRLRSARHALMGCAIALVAVLSASCSTAPDASTGGSDETRVYRSEAGDVEVPANPKRVAVMAHIYVGNLLQLGIKPIAVNEWVKGNRFFSGMLDGVEVVAGNAVEKLVELEPDLIIALSTDENLKKYAEIAPTISYTYGKYSYLDQHLEIGKLVGKEREAKAWIDEWTKKTSEKAREIKSIIGDEATVSVFETFGKDLYVYGKNWGRGTEILYQAFGLKAPEKVVQDVFGPGYKVISMEVIPQYAGDYILVGRGTGTDNAFMETDVWKNIPAVRNNRVIFYEADSFWFNDPISLEGQLNFLVQEFSKFKT